MTNLIPDITTVIVDDEPAAIQTLSNDLSNYSDIEIIGTETSSAKAEQLITRLQPDLIFIDVEMPEKSGIELLSALHGKIHANTFVVFYSAFDKYIIDALRASAFDYLLKPYQIAELDTIVGRVRQNLKTQTINIEQSLRRLLNNDQKFALQTVTGLLLLRSSEILYFHYIDSTRCWEVILTTMKRHHLRMSTKAKDILSLNTSFIRISSNSVLNIEYLSFIENGTAICRLYPPYNNLQLTASRRYLTKIKESLDLL